MHRFQHLLTDLVLDDRDGDLLRSTGHGALIAGSDTPNLARRQGGPFVLMLRPKGIGRRVGATLPGA